MSQEILIERATGATIVIWTLLDGDGPTTLRVRPFLSGRDTFIAIRGLYLATGRVGEARDILVAWAEHVSEGMLPNRFPDRAESPEFNSVDAALWFIVAAHELLQRRPESLLESRLPPEAAMTRRPAKRLTWGLVILAALTSTTSIHAQLYTGTWIQKSGTGAGSLIMTIEPCCNGGARIVYSIKGRGDILMTVESRLDGSDAPVLAGGKPTGETMGITRLDDHHSVTVVKMSGKPFGTSRATMSVDGKTLTVENDYTGGPQGLGKQTEIWVRQ